MDTYMTLTPHDANDNKACCTERQESRAANNLHLISLLKTLLVPRASALSLFPLYNKTFSTAKWFMLRKRRILYQLVLHAQASVLLL